MSVNPHDVAHMLRDIGDLIRTEGDLGTRLDLWNTFLDDTTDIAQDGFLGTIYEARMSGLTAEQIGEQIGVHRVTVSRWIAAYAERHSLPKVPPGRPRRELSAVQIRPASKRSTLRLRKAGAIPEM